MRKSYALALAISSLLLVGCGFTGEQRVYTANAVYAAMLDAIEIYAVDCATKAKDDLCHAQVDKAADVIEEVHPVMQQARQYTDEASRILQEANVNNALAKLLPVAKELGYVENK